MFFKGFLAKFVFCIFCTILLIINDAFPRGKASDFGDFYKAPSGRGLWFEHREKRWRSRRMYTLGFVGEYFNSFHHKWSPSLKREALVRFRLCW